MSGRRRPAIELDRKVAFLGAARAYPQAPRSVERIETHFSWVFLTERHVYKLKKPVRGDGFDFTSREARRRNAEIELRLNRRLAPGVYLAAIPLTWEPGRGLAVGGAGAPVDWLIKMTRLPAERMLDRRLAEGRWHYADIETLADRLARFFATAARAALAPPIVLDRLRAECRAGRRAFGKSGDAALRHQAEAAARRLEAFIARRRDLLLARLRERRLVDGHGDLRPEHICLGSTPHIIDCLEYSAALRALDPADELAFLAMECDRLRAPTIGPILFRRYCRRSGDRPPIELILFYKALRAFVRARLAIRHLDESPVRDPAKWPRRAGAYLSIARAALRRLDR